MPRRGTQHGPVRFRDRRDAGRRLAEALAGRSLDSPVVLALPRGGVPVAAEIADRLGAPLDVLIVRKLGCPGRRELGVGAIAEDGVQLRNERLIEQLGITPSELEPIVAGERAEVERRARRYRGDRPATAIEGRTVIVVDDGLATGFTARAAIDVLRLRHAATVVLAVPVAPAGTVEDLRAVADEVVCLQTPSSFMAIGQWYDDFTQVRDEEVTAVLDRHRASDDAGGTRTARARPTADDVRIAVGPVDLPGTLTVPSAPVGVVIFAHGSDSSRLSPRNVAVARRLQQAGLATVLFDLLTPREASDRANVFDIDLLAARLNGVTRWVARDRRTAGLRVGYFGASTGAAAALAAAAGRGGDIGAIVSRGGRPDLAGASLSAVTAPTLLIVGGDDWQVLALNRRAAADLGGPSRLEVIAGATHLFSEPGALDRVADLASDWFTRHLTGAGDTQRARTPPTTPLRPGQTG